MRVTLKDGTAVSTRYPKKQSDQTAAHLRAKGVAVTLLSKRGGRAQKSKQTKTHHHKIRYIVGGVVIVVIIVVARRAAASTAAAAGTEDAEDRRGRRPRSSQ